MVKVTKETKERELQAVVVDGSLYFAGNSGGVYRVSTDSTVIASGYLNLREANIQKGAIPLYEGDVIRVEF